MLKPFVSTFSSVGAGLVWLAISRSFFSPSSAVPRRADAEVFPFFETLVPRGVLGAEIFALDTGAFFALVFDGGDLVALVFLTVEAAFLGTLDAGTEVFFALGLVVDVLFFVIIREWREYLVSQAWQALLRIGEKPPPTVRLGLARAPIANSLGIERQARA
jgi:hypothetical protein